MFCTRKVVEVVSERKLQANGRNAKLSTGPKDTRRTRYNAQKHGLLSKAAIIKNGRAKEDPRELKTLLEALREDFQPEGAMEEILVDRIAACYWRLRRAQRAEVGEIRQLADDDFMNSLIHGADMEPEVVGLLRSLPDGDVLAKVIRYETAIDRQMYRALKELRELQAARLGGKATRHPVIIGMQESA